MNIGIIGFSIHLWMSRKIVGKLGHLLNWIPHRGPTDGDPSQGDNGHKRNPNSHSYQLTKDAKTVSSNSPASAILSTVSP